MFNLEQVVRAPAGLHGCSQFTDPCCHSLVPDRRRFFLDIRDHGTESVDRTVMSGLETLHTTGGGVLAENVLPLVAVFVFGGRKPLAFDGQNRVEVRVAAAVDPECRAAGRGNQIDLAALVLLIGLFDSELKDVQPIGMPGRAIEMSAELRCECGFRCLSFSVRAVSPARQLMGDKGEQFVPEGVREM